jgi:DNA invertase Pin-like site-specific DNA recombinase
MARISKSQLEKLQKKYQTDDAIGKLFGITRQAVHQLRNKYGIAPIEEKHSDRNHDIIRSYSQGMAGTKLARKFKLSISQTYRIINEAAGKIQVAKKGAKKAAKKKGK